MLPLLKTLLRTRLPKISSCRFPYIRPFRQIHCGRQIAQLVGGKGDVHRYPQARVELLDRGAIVKGVDDDIFAQGFGTLVNERNCCRIKVVLGGEHGGSLACAKVDCQISPWQYDRKKTEGS